MANDEAKYDKSKIVLPEDNPPPSQSVTERNLQRVYRSRCTHVVLLVLLVIDGIICLSSGVLDTQYLHGKVDDYKVFVKECTSAVVGRRLGSMTLPVDGEAYQQGDGSAGNAFPRFLSDDSGDEGHGHCSNAHFGNPTLHDTEIILTYISMGILSLFLLEQFTLIWYLKDQYFKNPLFLLDIFVISVSLTLEIVHMSAGLGGMLVMARTWRFARVAHGMVEGSHQVDEVAETFVDDSASVNMKSCWDMLKDEEWESFKYMSPESMMEENIIGEPEMKIVELLTHNPAVCLRALSFAKSYKEHCVKKQLKKAQAESPKKGTVESDNAC